jgi:hypothetical protein
MKIGLIFTPKKRSFSFVSFDEVETNFTSVKFEEGGAGKLKEKAQVSSFSTSQPSSLKQMLRVSIRVRVRVNARIRGLFWKQAIRLCVWS